MTHKLAVLFFLSIPSLAWGGAPSSGGDYGNKPALIAHFDNCGGAKTYSWQPPISMTVTGATCVDGKFGTAYRFGNVSDVISGNDTFFPSGNTPWTLWLWIKLIRGGTSQRIAHWGTVSSGGEVNIQIEATDHNLQVNFGWVNANLTNVILSPKTDTWDFLMVYWDGTNVNGCVVGYRGKVCQSAVPTQNPPGDPNVVLNGTFYVGNYLNACCSISGTMDDWNLFSGDARGRGWAAYWNGISAGYQ